METNTNETPKMVETNLEGLLVALGMSVADLRRDRRFANVRGDERIVLERKVGTFHIVDAPPWMCVQDFGPIGMSWARRAGWV